MNMSIDDIWSYIPSWGLIAGVVLATSPITSYLDTVLSIYKKKTSAGFSLDVCAIMLISSICRIYFYFGRPYELSLLAQSVLMVIIQLALLKLGLQYRPKPPLIPLTNSDNININNNNENRGHNDRPDTMSIKILKLIIGSTMIDNCHKTITLEDGSEKSRPFGFWIWDDENLYWGFLVRLCIWLAIFQFLLGNNEFYIESLGLIGLLIEAFLPLPQILTNASRGSVDGFRPSLLLSWLGGDVSKFAYLLTAEKIAPQFFICCVIQTLLDAFVGVQYYMYTSGKWKGNRQAQVNVKRQRADSLKRRRRASSLKREGEVVELSSSTFK